MADWNGFKKNGTPYIPNDATARADIATINGKIPEGASSSNKLATASDVAERFPRSEQAVLGAKNIAPINANTVTNNGITLTVDENDIITVSGTATEAVAFELTPRGQWLTNGKRYKLSGCKGGSANTYKLDIVYFDTGALAVNFDEDEVEFTANNARNYLMRIVVYTGQTMDNVVIKPMVRLATDPDPTYAPPAMTNRELTEMSKLRTVTPTIDGTIVKTYKGGLVAYNLLTRVCTFGMRLEIGAYANYTNFVTDLPKSKSIYSFPCVCTNFSRNVGMAVLTTSGNGGMYFTGLGQATNFADGDEINISGSYIIADDVVS